MKQRHRNNRSMNSRNIMSIPNPNKRLSQSKSKYLSLSNLFILNKSSFMMKK